MFYFILSLCGGRRDADYLLRVLQITVCADGAARINFEHGIDGHIVLLFAADIFTKGLILLARSINPSAPTLFHAPTATATATILDTIDTTPKKLKWKLTPQATRRVPIRRDEVEHADLPERVSGIGV